MLRQGPIPHFVHGLLEYVLGGLLIALPLVLGYDSGAATAASIVLGVLILFLAAASCSPVSLINQVPLPAHVLLDYALVGVLIAAPFLFGFSDESTPTAIFIAAGVLHLLVSVGTRFRKDEAPERGAPRATREVGAGGRRKGAADPEAAGEGAFEFDVDPAPGSRGGGERPRRERR